MVESSNSPKATDTIATGLELDAGADETKTGELKQGQIPEGVDEASREKVASAPPDTTIAGATTHPSSTTPVAEEWRSAVSTEMRLMADSVMPLPSPSREQPVGNPTPGAYSALPGNTHQRREPVRASLQAAERTLDPLRTELQPPQAQENNNNNNNVGLAVATEVDPRFELENIQRADEVPVSENQHQRKQKETRWFVGGIVIVVSLALILGISLGLANKRSQEEKATTTSPTTGAPSPATTMTPEAYIWNLLPLEIVESIPLDHKGTAASKALEWMVADPNFWNLSDARIVQRFALAAFYFSTNGEDWFNNDNWLSYEAHECDWYAVDVRGLIDSATWYSNWQDTVAFRGLTNITEFPCEESVDGERRYAHLWLTTNGLEGTIPEELYLLKNTLRSIVVGKNQLSGTISTSLGLLSHLIWLDLAPNREIHGTIPSELGLLTNVQEIFLSSAALTGTIPTELGLLTNLDYELEFSDCQLTGPIPSELGRLSKLEALAFPRNSLTGTIPTELGLLEEVEMMTIHRNHLTGTLPSEFGNLKKMRWCAIPGNDLTGTIPSELAKATSVTHLYLYEAAFTGTVPTELASMPDMVWFLFDKNLLTGTIPTEVGLLGKTEDVDFSDNFMTGTIPTEVGLLSNAKWLQVGNNFLTGTMPTELGQMHRNCTQIKVSHNRNLTGTLPSELGRLSILLGLYVESTSLTGTIPTELDYLGANGPLVFLNVSDTLLTGTISDDICGLGGHINTSDDCPWWNGDCPSFEYTCSESLCGCNCTCANG